MVGVKAHDEAAGSWDFQDIDDPEPPHALIPGGRLPFVVFGLGYHSTPKRWELFIPYWLLILLFLIVLCIVWRRTRAKDGRRGFPVIVQECSGQKVPSASDNEFLYYHAVSRRRDALANLGGATVFLAVIVTILYALGVDNNLFLWGIFAIYSIFCLLYFVFCVVPGGEWECWLTRQYLYIKSADQQIGTTIPTKDIECLVTKEDASAIDSPPNMAQWFIRMLDGKEIVISSEHIGSRFDFIELLKHANSQIYMKRESSSTT